MTYVICVVANHVVPFLAPRIDSAAVPFAHTRFIFAYLCNCHFLHSRLNASVLAALGCQRIKPSAMSQDKNVYPGMGETNPLHNNVYGPPQPGFGVPPPNYSQATGGPYPPAAGYSQPGFPPAGPGFAPGPYPQMPFPQMPYPQGPYPQGPYQHGPGQPGFSDDPSGEFTDIQGL